MPFPAPYDHTASPPCLQTPSICMDELSSTVQIIFSFLLFLHFIYHQNSTSHHHPLLSPPSHQPLHRWLPPSPAHIDASPTHCPWLWPLKHSSGRLQQWSSLALLMQMCSPTQIENLRDHFYTEEREAHNHTVCNADSYACDIDTQQSARLPFHPPPGQCYFWLRLGHMSLGSVHTAWLIRATSKKA